MIAHLLGGPRADVETVEVPALTAGLVYTPPGPAGADVDEGPAPARERYRLAGPAAGAGGAATYEFDGYA